MELVNLAELDVLIVLEKYVANVLMDFMLLLKENARCVKLDAPNARVLVNVHNTKVD